ncbi:MAG: DUF169 domain-containing protein [Muricomes sp.]
MERSIIGVRLFHTDEDYQNAEARELSRPINYCQMVAAASRGNAIKSKQDHIKCVSGIRVLGFDHTDLKNSAGENWTRLGLYKDAGISKNVRSRISNIPEQTCGILVQPLEKYTGMPDVVLIVTSPYNIMRLTQGYGYHYGEAKQMNMAGNQAVCLECTAAPYVNQDINISSLCIGTRHRAGWKDTEMAVGIPMSKFADIVDGVMQTVNIMESDAKKEQIEKKLIASGIKYEPIRYHYNYYMDC